MSLLSPLMQYDAGSASGAPLPGALDFPAADEAPGRRPSPAAGAAAEAVAPAPGARTLAGQTRRPVSPVPLVLLTGLAVMAVGGVSAGLALALGLGGPAGAAASLLLLLALGAALAALLSRQIALPARVALRRADSLVRHYTGQPLRAAGDDFSRIGQALDEVSAALLAHAERVRREHLDELRNGLELQRQYALMRLLRALAAGPREAGALAPMLRSALHEIGHYLDWPLGRVTELTADRDRLGPSVWRQPDGERFAKFIALVERAAAAGSAAAGGIGARAAATGMPHWITALAETRDFPLSADAAAAGLKTALAIPVMAHGRLVALIEFYADRRVEARAEMIDVVDAVCIEVSRAAEHFPAVAQPDGTARARDRAGVNTRDASALPRSPAAPMHRSS